MESAFAWLGQIIDWFGQWIPRYEIVDTTHGAIKWVGGSKVVSLGPGQHWYWPIRTKFQQFPVARQAANLITQTLVTQDDKTIVVGGLIVFEIKNLEAILAHTYDPDQTIKDIALSAIHRVVIGRTWAQIKDDFKTGALERELKAEAKRELDRYGVKVLKATLTDLATAKVYKVVQSTSQDGI